MPVQSLQQHNDRTPIEVINTTATISVHINIESFYDANNNADVYAWSTWAWGHMFDAGKSNTVHEAETDARASIKAWEEALAAR